MTETTERELPWKCVFCRMATGWRVLRAPLCEIRWEQLNDFIWVSSPVRTPAAPLRTQSR